MKDNRKADSELLAIQRNTFEVAVLLDFYGQLLTSRQYEILDLHYNNDLSLGEIAEELEISRQAAHDSIRKGKAILAGYEERLGLVNRFRVQENSIKEAVESLTQVEKEIEQIGDNQRFKQAVKALNRVLESL